MPFRGFGRRRYPPEIEARIPPGQTLTEKWPVLSYGRTPRFDPATWGLRVFGLVEEERRWTYEEFRALSTTKVTADVHCVTTWSLLGSEWEGVAVKELLRHVRLKPEARYVMQHCDGGYTTNLPLDVFLGDDVLLCYRRDGEDLTPDHGWPLRLVVPSRYFWKSAKWVRGLEFMAEDRLGFWELYGYNNHADPWKEERFA
ncbi:MAG TPA: sulfite oxidase-like oxidoreductase [Thermomicrobiales bacterium]|nr:sulfite oxidase-like oxidoreductase [Thermomicrobiales bacterium]